MPNKHQRKWRINAPVGFVFISLAVLSVYYAIGLKADPDNWFVWCLVTILLLTTGLGILGSAFVHKVKSDLIRKQKGKERRETMQGEIEEIE